MLSSSPLQPSKYAAILFPILLCSSVPVFVSQAPISRSRPLSVRNTFCTNANFLPFSNHVQVEMTVVSALFMLPAGLIFPALLRVANTPPVSQTLERPVSQEEQPDRAVQHHTDRRQVEREETDDDFQATLQIGERVKIGMLFSMPRTILAKPVPLRIISSLNTLTSGTRREDVQDGVSQGSYRFAYAHVLVYTGTNLLPWIFVDLFLSIRP